MNIEPLESRIVPAAVFTFTDVDGDVVKITTSLGTNADLTAAAFVFGGQLKYLDLTAAVFQGTDFSASVVTKSAMGDGLVNLGHIEATGRDLGRVTIAGDLGDIDCGDATTSTTALKSLSVRSLGRFGLATQGGVGDLESIVVGPMGSLTVQRDIVGANVYVNGAGDGDLGAAFVGGSLIGGATPNSGQIQTTGDLGPVTIGGDLVGGTDFLAGTLYGGAKMAGVTIAGSVIGGTSTFAGAIISNGDLGPVKIGGDFAGGLGTRSGRIEAMGKVASVSIHGSLLGGAAEGSGSISAGAALGPVSIGGNLVGHGEGSGVLSGTTISSVTIGGTLLGGAGELSGSIHAVGDLGPVKIGRDLKGGAGNDSGKIDAGGKLASVTIRGSVVGGSGHYDILTPTHRGQIFSGGTLGPVKIGGDVLGGAGNYSASIVSKGAIANVSIGGSLVGGAGEYSAIVFNQDAVKLGPVTIGHNLRGGAGLGSGRVTSNGELVSVTIGGSLIGGAGASSGVIGTDGASTAFVKIAHDLVGGSGAGSGVIGGANDVTIGGSLIGGSGNSSGGIYGYGLLKSVRIGHDLLGGSIPDLGAALDHSGFIECNGAIGRIWIGGSIVSGTDASSGTDGLTFNATIRAGRDIGSLTVRGDIVGNVTPAGDSPVIISAFGKEPVAGATSDLAIGKISVGRRVEWAQIFAGYNTTLVPKNADAQIGTVTVGADWIASSIVAGAVNLGADNAVGGTGLDADNVNFGDLHDRKITGGIDEPGTFSKIGSIAIGGRVFGTAESFRPDEGFGFVAEQIGALKVGARTFALTAGAGNDGMPVAWRTGLVQNDIKLHEVGASAIGFSFNLGPTATLVNATTVTYSEPDNDFVTVTLSQPLLTAGNVNDVFKFDSGTVGGTNLYGQQLQLLDLGKLATNDLSVSVTVVRSATGDGFADVGYLDARGYDLGSVVIPGDLGQIDAGSHTAGKLAVASLSVQTMGRLGFDTQLPPAMVTPSLQSEINGGFGALIVKQDLVGALLDINGVFGSVTIGGSLIGGDDLNSGAIYATGRIGAVKIGHHLQGGSGQDTGAIQSNTSIASLSIGGSMLGAGGLGSAATFGNVTGFVQIGHNVRGGTEQVTGAIFIDNGASVTIGGSLIGGHGGFGASIFAEGSMGAVRVAHNVLGDAISSGKISGATIASVTIGGSLLGGDGATSGSIAGKNIGPVSIAHDVQGGAGTDSGKIDAEARLASVRIGGSLLGGSGVDSGRIESGAKMGPVKIRGSVVGGVGSNTGRIDAIGGLAALSIGGSIIGGRGSFSGALSSNGSVGAVSIGGDLAGGSADLTGHLQLDGTVASLRIGGSLLGGSDNNTGRVQANEDVGAVAIRGDVLGGSGNFSGRLQLDGKTPAVTIGGSLIGGSGDVAGAIRGSDLGSVKIGRNIVGASVTGADSVDFSGSVQCDSIARITIGGSIFAGFDTSTGSLLGSGSISASHDIGTLSVRGSLHGTATPDGITPVVISALGQKTPTATINVAIKSISIGGSVERANILGGYTTDLTVGAPFAQVGTVTVGRDWIASNLVVGAQNLGADDNPGGAGADADNVNFGDTHDTYIGTGDIHNRIASIVIGGIVAGTDASGDHFGFVSHQIGSFKSLHFTAPLIPAANVIELSPTTGDVNIREV